MSRLNERNFNRMHRRYSTYSSEHRMQLRPHLGVFRPEADLFVHFSQRGADDGLSGFDGAARKAHLAAMLIHLVSAKSE